MRRRRSENRGRGASVKLGSSNVPDSCSFYNSHNIDRAVECLLVEECKGAIVASVRPWTHYEGDSSWLTQTTDSRGTRTTHTGGRISATAHMPRRDETTTSIAPVIDTAMKQLIDIRTAR